MNAISFARLLLLAAIWGAAFPFLRVSVPYLGPTLLIEVRVALAGLFLFFVGIALKQKLELKKYWKHYLILGFFSAAFPFYLFAHAAQHLSASMMAILNSTAPIWGVICTRIWHKTSFSYKTIIGISLGILGVVTLVGFDEVALKPEAMPAVIAILIATMSYGAVSTYAHSVKDVTPFANTHGGMWMAALILVPFLPFSPIIEAPTPNIIMSVIALGILCTGIAYFMYFQMIADTGATSALTVAYLIPVFGILWGAIFLDEHIGWHTVVGTIVVLAGTTLVTGFSIKSLLKKYNSN